MPAGVTSSAGGWAGPSSGVEVAGSSSTAGGRSVAVGESLSVLAGDGDPASEETVVGPTSVGADSWVEQATTANRITARKRANIDLFRTDK